MPFDPDTLRDRFESAVLARLHEMGAPVTTIRVLNPVRAGGAQMLRVDVHGARLWVSACCASEACAGWSITDGAGREVRTFADLAEAFRGVSV